MDDEDEDEDGGLLVQEVTCLLPLAHAVHEVVVIQDWWLRVGYSPCFKGEVGRTMRGVAALDCALE